MQNHQEIISELCGLENIRVQKIYGLFNSAIVFELYNFEYKKLFLILDTNKKNTTFHAQSFNIKNIKTSHPVILALRKYALNKLVKIICLDSKCQRVVILFGEKQDNLLICDFFPELKISYFFKEKLITITTGKNLPELPKLPKDLISCVCNNKNNNLKANFLQANIYQKNLNILASNLARNNIIKKLRKNAKKTEKLLANLRQDLNKCQKILSKKYQAELLKTNLKNTSRGQKYMLVLNYFLSNPKEEKIILDPSLSPQENLEKLFKNIKRSQRGEKIILSRIKEVKNNLENLQQEIIKIESGENFENFNFEDKIINKSKIKKPKHVSYREYRSQNNVKILVGKSAKDSDFLIKKICSGNHWWFHVRDTQGTHVVAQTSNLEQDILIDCCLLAAWFSKAKHDPRPIISYTQVKNLRKPKGFAPGKVLISQEKTLEIIIDKKRQERLLSQEIQS